MIQHASPKFVTIIDYNNSKIAVMVSPKFCYSLISFSRLSMLEYIG